MNTAPTPETDAAEHCIDEIPQFPFVSSNLARRLERERDSLTDQRDFAQNLIRILERERDEWVGKAVALCAERESNAMQALAYKAERDKLAEAIKQHQETLAMRPDYADHKLWADLATLNQSKP